MRVENLDHVFLCASSVLIAHPHVELCFAVIPIRGQLEAGKGHLVLPVLHVLKPWESNRNSRVKTVQAPLAWKWCTADQPPPGFVNTGEASSGRHSIPIQTSNSEVIPYSKDGGEASPCCCAPLWIQFPPSPPGHFLLGTPMFLLMHMLDHWKGALPRAARRSGWAPLSGKERCYLSASWLLSLTGPLLCCSALLRPVEAAWKSEVRGNPYK